MVKKEIDILIIEDSPTDTELLIDKIMDFKVFNCRGRVNTVTRGKDAEKLMLKREFDAILLDLNLPDSRGIDSLKRIIDIKKKAAVIIMTALSEQEIITEALNLGAQNYIVKGEESPVSLERAVMYSIEREKNIREIQKTRKMQEEIIRNSPVMMFLLDKNGDIIQANPEAESFLGKQSGGVKGAFNGRVFDCINSFKAEKGCGYSDDCAGCQLRALLTDALASGKPAYRKEINLTAKNAGRDNEKNLLVSVKALGDGGDSNILVSVEDITGLKHAEKTISESEKKFSAAFFSSPLVMMITRLSDGKILELNGKVSNISGYEREELLGKTTLEMNLWPAEKDRKKVVDEIKKRGYVPALELDLRSKSGKLVRCLFSSNITELNGEKCAISIVIDISERKKIQEELSASEEKFRTIFDTAPDLISIRDLETGVFVDVNSAYTRALGYSRGEVIGKTSIEAGISMDPAKTHALMKEVGEKGFFNDVELKFKKKNGEALDMMSSSVIINLEGKSYGLTISKDITERKKLENAILESEGKFRAAFEQAAVGMAYTSFKEGYTIVNRRYCEIIGYAREEAEKLKFNELTHPDDLERDKKVVEDMMAGRFSEYKTEKRFIRKDKTTVWVNLNISMVGNPDGSPKYLVAAFEDITARKQAERDALFFAEMQAALSGAAGLQDIYTQMAERIRALIGASVVIVTMLDETRQEIKVASYSGLGGITEKIVELLKEDPIKKTYKLAGMKESEINLFTSSKLELVKDGIYTLAVRTIPRALCDVIQKLINVKYVYTIGFVSDGRHFGGVTILAPADLKEFRNVIERAVPYAANTIKRKVAEEALKQSEEKWTVFTDSANDILTIWDNRLRLVAANKAAFNEYNAVTDKKLEMGRNILELGRDLNLPPRYRQFVSLLRSGTPVVSEEYGFAAASGEYKTYSFKAFKLAAGMGLIISNITELKRSEMILKQSYEKLKEVDRLKSNFISIISHELRTPLTIIKGFTSFLIKEAAGPLNDAQKNFAETIDINTARLARIINDMVDVSKIESGTLSIEKERYDLAAVIREAVEGMRHIAEEAGISLETEIEQGNASMEIDKGRMMQTITNLINNSIRFSKKGGTITVGLKPAGDGGVPGQFKGKISEETGYYLMSVSDTGAGMEKQYLEKIFERFYQVENANVRKHQGAGLGLSIAKNIVEAHGGFIWAESDGPGKGAKICMLLPE